MKLVNSNYCFKQGLTILELIIAMALLSMISYVLFIIGQPLRLQTELVDTHLKQIDELQHTTLLLDDMIHVFGMPRILKGSELNIEIAPEFRTVIQGRLYQESDYLLFNHNQQTVICGDINTNISCIFMSNKAIFDINLVNIISFGETSYRFSLSTVFDQMYLDIGTYRLTTGFLPSVQQVVQ